MSTCALLFQLAGGQEAHLSAADQIWLRFRQRQLACASAQWPQALRIFEGLWGEKLPPYMGGVLANDLGSLYQAKGEWERAIEYYERSLAIKEKVGDEVGAATTMYNIASLYEDMDRYDEAVELLERVVEIDERVGHPNLQSDRKTLERIRRKAK